MVDEDGTPFTAHTTNPVRLILVDDRRHITLLRDWIFADVAPTRLELLRLLVPAEMTGTSLLVSALTDQLMATASRAP
jgi:2,3-bisphosphoglycerate-independent phosphoglycerate mutase